ncbi:MAG: nitrous oxide reductase accessory protein NosL [Trueperaceae bacterium]|nr:nitrous oxide reductase accessory protein NosL [Trueperaceae bacterium]
MPFEPEATKIADTTTPVATGPAATLDRRQVLRLGGAALAAALTGAVHAQGMMHQHGADGTPASGTMGAPAGGAAVAGPPAGARGTGHPHAHAIPWGEGGCAFCDMTLATPEGFPQGAGFRERTYAQWAFAGEARHFESIGCALGWAYAHGVLDGEGAALYVAGYDAAPAQGPADLLAGREATFVWAERLPTSMRARWGAFADQRAAAAFMAGRAELGRRRYADLALLEDLAPLPLMNLIPLLARQAGLLG